MSNDAAWHDFHERWAKEFKKVTGTALIPDEEPYTSYRKEWLRLYVSGELPQKNPFDWGIEGVRKSYNMEPGTFKLFVFLLTGD